METNLFEILITSAADGSRSLTVDDCRRRCLSGAASLSARETEGIHEIFELLAD
jgi:hypothetical protein